MIKKLFQSKKHNSNFTEKHSRITKKSSLQANNFLGIRDLLLEIILIETILK